jgi:hypothetical protein
VRSIGARALLMFALVGALIAATPVAANGATIQRTWTATFAGAATAGPSAGGSGMLVRYWSGSGTFSAKFQGLLPSRTYAEAIYQGTCAKPTVLLRLPNLATDANGSVTASSAITVARMTPVWNKASVGPIALRISSGGDLHCAVLTYPVATRVAVPKLGIDLPIVLQRGSAFPYCNVAMYLTGLSQPGEAGVTFLYAHARTGMFLPLLNASLFNNGARMIGMTVNVWTSDDRLITYRITRVLRHQYSLPDLWSIHSQQLWLQTSEGPYGTYNKLMVVAVPVSVTPASHADAHPTARPLVCSKY